MRLRAFVSIVTFAIIASIGYAARFDYVTASGQALRTNRFTGSTEVLRPGQGWKPIKTSAARYAPPSPIALSAECKSARRDNPYADLMTWPCDAKELSKARLN